RSAHREELERHIRDWVAERPAAEVIREFRRVDAPVAPVLAMADIFHHPHFLARGTITKVDAEAMKKLAPRLSKTAGSIRHAGRPSDADTAEVLRRLAAAPDREVK